MSLVQPASFIIGGYRPTPLNRMSNDRLPVPTTMGREGERGKGSRWWFLNEKADRKKKNEGVEEVEAKWKER